MIHSELDKAIGRYRGSLQSPYISSSARAANRTILGALVRGKARIAAIMGTYKDHEAYEQSIGAISGMPGDSSYIPQES